MKQSISSSYGYKPKWQQTLAAVLILFTMLAPYISTPIIHSLVYQLDLDSSMAGLIVALQGCLYVFLGIIAYTLLMKQAANKPTRVAMITTIATNAVCIILNMVGSVLNTADVDMPVVVSTILACIYRIIPAIVTFYAVMLVLQNNVLEQPVKSWIVLLAVLATYNTALMVVSMTPVYWHSMTILRWPILILQLIAWWKFARCSAFAGADELQYDATANYSLLNRYVAGYLIAALLLTVSLYFVFAYAEAFDVLSIE